MFHPKHILALILSLGLTACAVGPDYVRPETKVDNTRDYVNAPETNASEVITRWWERLDDPLMDKFVTDLLSQNLDLVQASERVIQAEETLNIQRGGFFPTLGAEGSASRSFTSNTRLGSAFQTTRFYNNNYEATLSSSWELDLFGRIRRNVESAKATYLASESDKDALTQSLIADLMNRRVAIAVSKELLSLAQQNAQNRERFYNLVKQRYDLGTASVTSSDLYLAEENYTSVKADISGFERLLAEESYALDVLLGQKPGTTDIQISSFPLITPPIDVPLCLPADLLDRRPDLRASGFRLKATNADIGVAIADLYPSLSLGGNIGFSGNETRNLFSADQLAGSIIGSITNRIFEGGALRANIRLQESEAREMAASYAQDVLNAMREVEIALKNEQEITKELENIQKSAQALRSAEKTSKERYKSGIITLQDFLDIQQRRYLAEQNYLTTQQQKWNARIALYLALGGDWLGDNKGYQTQCDIVQEELIEEEVQDG